MPSRNVRKEYIENGIYHVYNRGIDKRIIFVDESDYKFLLYILKSYILPLEEQKKLKMVKEGEVLKRGFFAGKIEILSYALMPNHYHLLIRQIGKHDLSEFMRSVITTYVSYFNDKYDRGGHLFQGVYRAVLVENDDYLLHLSRYIHLNPAQNRSDLSQKKLVNQYTSYGDYVGIRNTGWVMPEFILNFFTRMDKAGLYEANNYESFVRDLEIDEHGYLGHYALD